ncbi:MAG: NAD(P)/FAD-dependent oxidoreductase [Thermodesulfobacteriota bacterium]
MKDDFVIIGGGIVGVSMACELAKYRLRVTLLEKEAELSFGVSKANSGIVHTGFQSDRRLLKTRLAVRGNELYRAMAKALDFPFLPIGELVIALPEEREGLEAMKENGEKLGIPGLQIVNRAWLRKNEPNLSRDFECALLGPTAAVINPYETIYAMAENAAANGVRIHCDHEVTGIERGHDRWIVKTSGGTFLSSRVINAAGLFSDRIARMAGIEVPEIVPLKGEEYLLDKHNRRLTSRIIFPMPTKTTKGVLVIPTVDGNTMIGPTAVGVHDRGDVKTSETGRQSVLANIRRTIPSVREDQIIASFAGLRPTTKEGDFHIREDREGFVNLVGIQSPGLTAGPAIAEYVVRMLSGSVNFEPRDGHVSRRASIPRFRALGTAERNDLIRENPEFGEVVCRCELVTKAEIREAIRRGARTLDGIKFRTRSQMGRCHGSFCTMRIIAILAEELGIPYEAVTKRGKGSEVVKSHAA